MTQISANELRVGNWVCSQYKIAKTMLICSECYIVDFGEGEITCIELDQIEPIHITPEWLERFGFEKVEILDCGECYYQLRLSNIVYNDLTLISVDKNGYMEVCLFPYEEAFRYRYIHQLQNQYFALTGTELTIEP